MEYLPKTKELLFEPSFLKFARMWNEGFAMLDDNHYAVVSTIDNAFYVDVKTWLALCKNVKLVRIFDGVAAPFVVYVGRRIQTMIRSEWDTFDKSLKEQNEKTRDRLIREFLGEVKEVGRVCKNKDYLEPVQKFIIETIGSIETHYQYALSMNNTTITQNDTVEVERIQWNAENTLLYGLLLDLVSAKLPNNKRYLSASLPRIAKLLADNFTDANGKPFIEDDVKRYVTKSNPKRIARKFRFDVDDIVKVPDPNKAS